MTILILIVDEAHSSGVVGDNFLGVFELFGIITPQANHIKMGTLGKAYGSYGAYILSLKAYSRVFTKQSKISSVCNCPFIGRY